MEHERALSSSDWGAWTNHWLWRRFRVVVDVVVVADSPLQLTNGVGIIVGILLQITVGIVTIADIPLQLIVGIVTIVDILLQFIVGIVYVANNESQENPVATCCWHCD